MNVCLLRVPLAALLLLAMGALPAVAQADAAASAQNAPVWRGNPDGQEVPDDVEYHTGLVVETSGNVSRDIVVRFGNEEERTVSIPRNTPIWRHRKPVSVHDLDAWEDVRVYVRKSDWRQNGRVRAVQVIAYGVRSGYESDWGTGNVRFTTVSGDITAVDVRGEALRMRDGGRTLTVFAAGADIRDGRATRRLRDLRERDRVSVEGYVDATQNRVYALRVTRR